MWQEKINRFEEFEKLWHVKMFCTKWFRCPKCKHYRIEDVKDSIPLCIRCNGVPCVLDIAPAKKYKREPTDRKLDEMAAKWLDDIRGKTPEEVTLRYPKKSRILLSKDGKVRKEGKTS